MSAQRAHDLSAVEAVPALPSAGATPIDAPFGGRQGAIDAETFRSAGHALIDWIADYREGIARRRVAELPPPGTIRAMLPARAPEAGEPIARILGDLDEIVMKGVVHWQHPGWFAYFPANSSYESILGELASAGLGVQGMLWSTSPASRARSQSCAD